MYLCISVSLCLCICVSMYVWLGACMQCMHSCMHWYIYIYTLGRCNGPPNPLVWDHFTLHPSVDRWVCISIYLLVLVIQKKLGYPKPFVSPSKSHNRSMMLGVPSFHTVFLNIYVWYTWFILAGPKQIQQQKSSLLDFLVCLKIWYPMSS